eukprot:CAMPEP_0197522816 /NCGR_PEP_ID=MMETSP1318-20131121/7873_1 /TAXON_ID=552666 /ORGANISM="Partenskyella glossopodia, Strain RCC365" /LENGTH=614 /DNA_ID=CAMNT_0043075309 /DNA_START=23 /DNA_END=1864 /DNA_ORIENTATION=+
MPKPPDYECDHPNLNWIPCRDKSRLHIPCLIFPQRKARFLLIYVHGNACDLGSVYNEVRYVSDFLGVHLVAMELRGYGLSQGSPSEKAINDDIYELFAFLTSILQFPAERIIFFGRSIGTGPTSRLVARLNKKGIQVGGLILQSPYTSILNVSRHLAGVAADLVVAERWRNIDEIKYVRSPLLVIHGKLDSLIPYSMANELFNSCPSKRKTLVLPDMSDHNTFNLYNDILRPVAQFLRTHCQGIAREVGYIKSRAAKERKNKHPKPNRPQEGFDEEAARLFELQPVSLNLPKFIQDVPFYAWELHPDCKAIMSRLKKANINHSVHPIIRSPPQHPAPPKPGRNPVIPTTNPEIKMGFVAASLSLSTSGLKRAGSISKRTTAITAKSVKKKNRQKQQDQKDAAEWEVAFVAMEVAFENMQVELMEKKTQQDKTKDRKRNTNPKSNFASVRDLPVEESFVDSALGDVEALCLVESIEGVLLCGLKEEVKKLDPPTFWPVIVDACKLCSGASENSRRDFATDVRYIAQQEITPSEAHCSLGRAWVKHLLANDRLHSALETILKLPKNKIKNKKTRKLVANTTPACDEPKPSTPTTGNTATTAADAKTTTTTTTTTTT